MTPSFLLAAILATQDLPGAAAARAPEGLRADAAAELAARCSSAIPWIDDPQKFTDGRSRRGASKPAPPPEVDRIAMLASARKRAAEEQRLVLWYVYRFEGRQMYRAPVVADYMDSVLFTDPDVADIVTRKFVPLRMYCDKNVGTTVGLRPLDVVEPAVVFMTPDGKIVHCIDRIRTFNAPWFRDQIKKVLAANPGFNVPSEEAKRQRTGPHRGQIPALAESMMRDGDDEAALSYLEANAGAILPEDTARGHYLRATALRRMREPDRAIAELDQAASATQDAALQSLVETERGIVQFLRGDLPSARKTLAQARKTRPGCPRGAEAEYTLALIDLQSGDEASALARFTTTVSSFPESPFAWKAATNLVEANDTTPSGAAMHSFESSGWLAGEVHTALASGTGWPRTSADPETIAKQAVEFLLRQQRSHGGWTDSRYAYWPDPKILPNTWVAISALAATALLEWKDVDPERIAAALDRAEGFFLDEARMKRGINEDVYVDAYKLMYLTRKLGLATDELRKKATLEQMNEVVKGAASRQKEDGAWAHEYPNPFCTGAMLWSLREAKNAGAEVPDDVLSKGVSALLAARSENGAYSYGQPRPPRADGAGSQPAAERQHSLKDAMARMPMCEATLLTFGRSEESRVVAAMDNYWKHWDRIVKVLKCDFHSDGELAGFFFWHGLFHTTEANRVLPDEARKANQAAFLTRIKTLPEIDGSFVDSHEMGKSYGTAMALLSLKNVLPEK